MSKVKKEKTKPNGYWYKLENIKAEALKYKSRSAFQKGCKSAYEAARLNNYLDIVCEHMPKLVKPVGYWTKIKCGELAAHYHTKVEFIQNAANVYNTARKNGWLKDITKHMNRPVSSTKWTYENCKEEAKKYWKRSEFKKGKLNAYLIASKNNWLDEFFPKKQKKED